jgi:glycosyltransferase involved in cell wall biosynthesis
MSQLMRVAWFSPLPPVRSGVASLAQPLLARLDATLAVDRFVEGLGRRDGGRVFDAHDFVWKHQRRPYDLVTYHLGNASCHDYIWAYLTLYPGLVVLHDPRLHHARARRLLSQGRLEDYRREFRYDHPEAPATAAEYAIAGLGGSINYLWSMLRVVMRTARLVAVHNERVAADLREQYPEASIAAVRLGTPPVATSDAARARMRAALDLADSSIVFAIFGTLTAEKRIPSVIRACAALRSRMDLALLLVGDPAGCPGLQEQVAEAGLADLARITGYVADESIGEYLSAADVCLCLRWPTAEETSAAWLQCLAAGRATIISSLAHLVDVPSLDPGTWTPTHPSREPVTVAVDLLDEDRSLLLAMTRLACDPGLRADLARAGRDYWVSEHTLDLMAADYVRVMHEARLRPGPAASHLPPHFVRDYGEPSRAILAQFGIEPMV